MRRFEPAFAVLVILLMVAAGPLDKVLPSHPVAAAGGPGVGAGVATAAGPLLSEAWYCPSPAAQALSATVATGNLNAGPVHLRRTGTGADGSPTELDLAPTTLGAVTAASTTGVFPTVIEAFGGPTASHIGVAAQNAGGADARCSNTPGTRWIFPEASTAPGYDTYLLVANPFQEEATISVRILAPGGDQTPSGLDQVEIPQLSQTSIFLGDYYPETAGIGLDVTASRGRVVVARLMKVAARGGVRGLTLDVGATAPSTHWVLPGGTVPSQGEEDLVVVNPSDHEALVSTVFQVESGGAPAGDQDVPVPAGSQTVLKVSDKVPGGTRYATIVSTGNGVPVVVERLTIGPQQAFQTVQGVPGFGTRWAVAAGSTAGGTDTLALVSAGPDAATCRVTLLTTAGPSTPSQLASVQVTPGQRTSIDLTPYLNGQPAMALVEATSGAVAVENDDALPGTYKETVQSVGIPLS